MKIEIKHQFFITKMEWKTFLDIQINILHSLTMLENKQADTLLINQLNLNKELFHKKTYKLRYGWTNDFKPQLLGKE